MGTAGSDGRELRNREARLRRVAEGQGLRLAKSRRRDELAPDYNHFWLYDTGQNDKMVLGGEYGVDIDEAEGYLLGGYREVADDAHAKSATPPVPKRADSDDGDRAPLRCDHVWSYIRGFGLLTTTQGRGSRGDPRGFWLVMAASGQVLLARAHGPHYDASTEPTFRAESASATRTTVKGRVLTMHFGDKAREVIFTGREEAPDLASFGLAVFGDIGEMFHLGREATEQIGAKGRQSAAMAAWEPVLTGQIPWNEISRA